MRRSAAFEGPPVPLRSPPFLLHFATARSHLRTPTGSGPLGASKHSGRQLLYPGRRLRQVFDWPPGPGPTPRIIVPNITRLGNRPSFCRATVPAKKSRRLPMAVSMPSLRLLEAVRVREGGVVGTLSALEADDSQEDLVHRLDSDEVVLC